MSNVTKRSRFNTYFGSIFKKYTVLAPILIAFLVYTAIFAFDRYGLFALLLPYGGEKLFVYLFLAIAGVLIALPLFIRMKEKSINSADLMVISLLFAGVLLVLDCVLFGRIFHTGKTPDAKVLKLIGDVTGGKSLGEYALIIPLSNWTLGKTIFVSIYLAFFGTLAIARMIMTASNKPRVKFETTSNLVNYYTEVFGRYDFESLVFIGILLFFIISAFNYGSFYFDFIRKVFYASKPLSIIGAVVIAILFIYLMTSMMRKGVTTFDGIVIATFVAGIFLLLKFPYLHSKFYTALSITIVASSVLLSIFRMRTYNYGNNAKEKSVKVIIYVILAVLITVALIFVLNQHYVQDSVKLFGSIAIAIVSGVSIFAVAFTVLKRDKESDTYFGQFFKKYNFVLLLLLGSFTSVIMAYARTYGLIYYMFHRHITIGWGARVLILGSFGIFALIAALALIASFVGLFAKKDKVSILDAAPITLTIMGIFAIPSFIFAPFPLWAVLAVSGGTVLAILLTVLRIKSVSKRLTK